MKIAIVLGTRPEIIKMAPIIDEIGKRGIDLVLLHTGQHYDKEMSDNFFKDLEIPAPDYNIHVGSGSHGKQTGLMMQGIEEVMIDEKPDIVLVQGDTNAVLAGALVASKLHIPVGHVEAGLRSFDMTMPEEINRMAADVCSLMYFVPTEESAINLLAENKLTQYNQAGKVDCETSLEINNPIYNVNNKYIAISEKNGTEINLISGSDILWTKKVDGNVSQLDVNSNGYVSAILTGTTYKSVIITFDKDGNELFKIYRSSTTVVDTNISDDNKHLAFAEVNTSGTTIESVIKIISIEKAKVSSDDFIESTYTADSNKLILGIRFQGNDSLVCMYDEEISILENGNNTVILSLNEKGKNINFANINLENCIYRSTEQNEGLFNTNTVVEIKNITNNKITIRSIEGAAKYIYSYNNIIAVDLGQEIEFINTSGWLLKSYSSDQEIQNVVIGNGIAGIVYKDKLEFLNL